MRRAHPATANPRRWRALRRRIFERDGYRCRRCGKAGRLELDHRRPIYRRFAKATGAPWWDPENLQALCRGCHIAKTRRENRGTRPRSRWEAENRRWEALIAERLGPQ